MRRVVVPVAFALALATGLVLAELRLVVLDPLGADGASARATATATANTAVVRRFYDAVNQTLLTGDAAPLDHLLDAGFVEHTPRPGQTSDRAGLVRYLQTLHRAAPALWLTGHDLVAQGDRVVALVRVEGADGRLGSGLPAVTGRAWGTIDAFRLRAGRIVEHWGDAAGLAIVEPLLAITVPVEAPTTKMVEAGRQTYPPRAADRHWASGPTILVVESGALTIAHDPISTDAATVIRASAARRPLPPGDVAVLAVGDALVLGSRSLYETRNDGATPAAALTVWSGNPTFPSGNDPATAARADRSGAPAPGATYEALAGGLLALLPDEGATVAIGRIALAPGASAVRYRVANVAFVVVESGRLALTVEEGEAWVRTGPTASALQATDAPLAAGAGIAFDAGATIAFGPAENEPLVVLVISIGPAIAGGATAP